jgi:hypothetical protein
MNRVLPPDVFTTLCRLGDPDLENTPAEQRTLANLCQWPNLLPENVVPDPEKLVVAQRLFGDYTAEISGALLLAALPQSYATGYGSRVLVANGKLTSDLARRIGRTAQFLVTILQQGKDDDKDQNRLWNYQASGEQTEGLPWVACLNLRLRHQVIRDSLTSSDDEAVMLLLGTATRAPDGRSVSMSSVRDHTPLNQEDLLGMLLTFSFAVFEVLDLYGISWTADEQESYLHLWDLVGGYLGIGSKTVRDALTGPCAIPADWLGLRPPTIERSRRLLDQIRGRQWVDPTPEANVTAKTWTSLRSGRILTRALLDELQEGMPPLLKPLPIAVMRALSPRVVRDRLNLGGNGVLLQSLSLMPKRPVRVGPFTSINSPNRFAGRVLRSLANDVTARASVHFRANPELKMPSGFDWHDVR